MTKRLPFYALTCFFVLLYTHGLWSRLGVPKLALEATLMALLLAVLVDQWAFFHKPAPGFLFIWFYLGWSLAACIYNDEGVLRGLLYPRYLIASYLVFWAVWSSRFTGRQLLRINGVIFVMFFVQVAAASFYSLVLHQRFEYVVGTMGYGGGGIATTFPMFGFGCLLALFLYYNRVIFLLAAYSFFLVGYASGKLGIYFLIPPLLVLGVALYAITEGVPNAIRRSRVIVLIGACTLPFLVFFISQTRRAETLRMQNEVGLYKKMAAFFSYSSAQHMDSESRSWYTMTRTSTSRRVIEETWRGGPLVFLFGRGPGACVSEGVKSDETVSRYGIVYGIVGWSADAFAVGWPAMVAHVGFYSALLCQVLKATRRKALNPYGKAVLLMVELGFFVFLFNYFLYAPSFTVGGWVSSVYLCLLAMLLAPEPSEALRIHATVSPLRILPATLGVTGRRISHQPFLPRSTLW